jgi:hypothetical protein
MDHLCSDNLTTAISTIKMMKKPALLLIIYSVFLYVSGSSQTAEPRGPGLSASHRSAGQQPAEIRVPMTADHWIFPAGRVQFVVYRGVPAMKIAGNTDPIVLKDLDFADGTIEYDIEPQKPSFTSIYFRVKDKNESECFYLRIHASGNALAFDALQYAPIIRGIILWDLFPYYQGGADIKLNEWNHVKLVVSGKQMVVFVNDQSRAALEVPRLEGETTIGKLALDGDSVCIANLVVKPKDVGGLSPKEGFDPEQADPRYLRTWEVNTPSSLPAGQEPYPGGLGKIDSSWQPITAERRGLVNLSRKFAVVSDRHPWELDRQVVWLRVKLHSETAQKKLLRLGFAHEVWVFMNGSMVFVDKNLYAQSMRKTPDGRISIENAAFEVPFRAGENELLVAIANNFYGWGLMARLEDMEGLRKQSVDQAK